MQKDKEESWYFLIRNARRELILEKQLIANQRIEVLQKEKENAVNLKREQAYKAMIEKEKALEIVAMIKRAPDHKTANERLKELESRLTKSKTEGFYYKKEI